ncbi:DUF6233 domain-containing protein [Streptomyces sp. 142MFCol3.1]|uniref:DUF6233 domain-containing protein n=1 Tax=Streptomyces sp. 142MFCol3.1 TaxID=1172179 RepID=UPI00041973F7|nr:DUF6233 domain-containing protein [Streptomyces sp. 142MFCol3.1]
MFDDLPPDLDRLATLRAWHAMWLGRIDGKIAALRQREEEKERGAQRRPSPDWVVELGIGDGRPPLLVHAGWCREGKRKRPISAQDAIHFIVDGVEPCGRCHPHQELGLSEY